MTTKVLWFLLSGGVGFAIYLCLSALFFYALGVAPVPSALIAMGISVFPTYLLQKRLTFKGTGPASRDLPPYLALQVANAGVIALMTHICTILGLPGLVSFGVAGLTGAAVSFAVQQKYIFHARS